MNDLMDSICHNPLFFKRNALLSSDLNPMQVWFMYCGPATCLRLVTGVAMVRSDVQFAPVQMEEVTAAVK